MYMQKKDNYISKHFEEEKESRTGQEPGSPA